MLFYLRHGPDVRQLAAALALIPLTIFVALKVDGSIDWTWWQVFSPLFVLTALLAYFTLVVAMRLLVEGQTKRAAYYSFQLVLLIAPFFAFGMLLVQKLNGTLAGGWAVVLAPLWIGCGAGALFALSSS